jgi:hypothetical protein
MSEGSIGVQVITPQTGTTPQSQPQQQANERERIQPAEPKQAPEPPGMGKYVDKMA